MRFASVCSGIEAASVAWHEFGWESAWLAEVDVAASAVLAHRFGATAPKNMPSPADAGLSAEERKSRQTAIKSLGRIKWGDRLINWGDMTRLPDLVRLGVAEAPDILCGGTPCQSFSLAGLRSGLSDSRGQLTFSFVELANAIDDRRASVGQPPCAIFWENVPGIRSDAGNAFGHLLAGLVGAEDPLEPGPRPEPGRSSAHWIWKKETGEHVPKWPSAGVASGPRRTVGWRSSDAQFFALAQRRERVFLVASAREGFDPQAVLLEFDGLRRDSPPSREAGEDLAGTLAARTDGGGFPGTDEACSGYVQPLGPERSAELVPQWWDGSPVSQTLDAVLHKGQTMPEKNRFPAVLQPTTYANAGHFGAMQEVSVSDPIRAKGGDTGGGGESLVVTIPILEAGARTGASTTDIRAGMGIGEDGDPMFTLSASKQHAVALSVTLRGREGGGTAELGDDLSGTLRASGGGGDKQHVLTVHGTQDPCFSDHLAFALGRNNGQENAVCVTGDITHTLKAEGFDASEDGTGRGQPIIAFDTTQITSPGNFSNPQPGAPCHPLAAGAHPPAIASEMTVRRLMPIEAERLMGFPDGWTLVPVGSGWAADGPRYKQLGNSWAVPCVRWIGRRLDRHLAELDGAIIEGTAVELTDEALATWMLAA